MAAKTLQLLWQNGYWWPAEPAADREFLILDRIRMRESDLVLLWAKGFVLRNIKTGERIGKVDVKA